jgi:glc operon protein GlcG
MQHIATLDLDEARRAVEAILRAAAGGGPIAVAVTDANGDLVCYARMDGTTKTAQRMAVRKAYTAARIGADTGAWGEQLAKLGITAAEFGDEVLTRFQGGLCVRFDNQVAGAIAVSGRRAADDEALARIGLEAMVSAAEPDA